MFNINLFLYLAYVNQLLILQKNRINISKNHQLLIFNINDVTGKVY